MSDAGSKPTGPGVFVPARHIPAPSTVSPQAQAFLAQATDMARTPPDPADKAAWRAYAEEGNRSLTAMMAGNADLYDCAVTEHALGEAVLYEVTPANLSPDGDGAIIYYIHGGAYVHGSGLAAAYMAMPTAHAARLRCFAIDYRMPPDHPFPAGLDDAVAGYRHLREAYWADRIAVAGSSAGGGLAASMILKLRDLGLTMPGAAVLGTPECDLAEAGDTFETNAEIDVVLRRRLRESIAVYAAGHDLADPYLSAVNGDFSKGFPPAILTSGTRDLFLSNTVRLHRALRRAGIEAELHVWEAMPHGGFFGAPEDGEVLAEQARFIREKLLLYP